MNKQSIIFIALGVLILAGFGYWLLKPAPKQEFANQNQTTNSQQEAPKIQTQSNIIEASFNYTGTGYEPKSVRMEQGQKVVLRVTAPSIADEVHLHGYDLSKPLAIGGEAVIEFTADKTGRFELELEDIGQPLGAIEVYPK